MRRLLWQVRSLGITTLGTFPKADTMDSLGTFLGTSSWTTRNVSGNVSEKLFCEGMDCFLEIWERF
jgi:hypothetical protein